MATCCPHCGHQFSDTPELAGQVVACPHCGGHCLLLPNTIPPPLPVIVERPRSQLGIRRRGSSGSKFIRGLILLLTVLWPIGAMILAGVELEAAKKDVRQIAKGYYIFTDEVVATQQTIPLSQRDVEIREQHAMFNGMIEATVIYAVLLTVLLAWWFYVRAE
jgi:DNA-directed RNA polymerase subunit RPC12/RpoP